MSTTQRRSQTAFVAVTILTVMAMTTVFIAYSVLLRSYTGGTVNITSIGGQIEYAAENNASITWTTALTQGAKAQWFARIAITGSPAQQVTVTWTLYNATAGGSVITDFTTSTITLTTSTQYIYASSNGLIANNHNWGDHSIVAANYQVNAQVDSVP